MWFPDSLQISKALIQAELDGAVPSGTIAATAAFTMNSATKETAKPILEKYNLNREAARIAWRFLTTGQIVTSDGEILTETVGERSPAPSPAVSPTASPDSSTFSQVTSDVNDILVRYFPDWVAATTDQAQAMVQYGGTLATVEDVFYTLANNGQDIKNPISLALHILKTNDPEKIQQDKEILQKKGRTSTSFVRETMRKADAVISQQPVPEATEASLDMIRKLREKVERGNS